MIKGNQFSVLEWIPFCFPEIDVNIRLQNTDATLLQPAKLGCKRSRGTNSTEKALQCTIVHKRISPHKINHWKIRNCIGKCALGYILLVHQNLYLNFTSSMQSPKIEKVLPKPFEHETFSDYWVFPTEQIVSQGSWWWISKFNHLVAKVGINAPGSQICKYCKWQHLLAKFETNISSTIWWPKL